VPLIIADGKRWRTGTTGPTITAPGRTVAARNNTLDIYKTLFTDAFHASIANTPTLVTTDITCRGSASAR
jgi:hypothetical protein